MVKLGITGDVMLGRLVDEYIFGDPGQNPSYIWGNTLRLFEGVDLRLINLECVISTKGEAWTKTPKVFHFRARPRAIEALKAAKIDYVSLANNHALDYGKDALLECLTLLRDSGIAFSGAGRNIKEAIQPASLGISHLKNSYIRRSSNIRTGSGYLQKAGMKVGVISLTDNEPAWEAKENTPGINFINYDEDGLCEPYFSKTKESIANAKQNADFVIASSHVGPNWGKPSKQIQALAHQLIGFGADLYWGHSNHTVQGIEVYQGKPILYSTGDFIDDYAVDPLERNDLSFFFEVHLENKKVKKILLHPVKIENFQVNLASSSDAVWLAKSMITFSEEFGTKILQQNYALVLDLE